MSSLQDYSRGWEAKGEENDKSFCWVYEFSLQIWTEKLTKCVMDRQAGDCRNSATGNCFSLQHYVKENTVKPGVKTEENRRGERSMRGVGVYRPNKKSIKSPKSSKRQVWYGKKRTHLWLWCNRWARAREPVVVAKDLRWSVKHKATQQGGWKKAHTAHSCGHVAHRGLQAQDAQSLHPAFHVIFLAFFVRLGFHNKQRHSASSDGEGGRRRLQHTYPPWHWIE